MKQPNNQRNRWRRYRLTRAGYGFTAAPFRTWAKTASPTSYATHPGAPNEVVPLFACRCRRNFICLCKVPTW